VGRKGTRMEGREKERKWVKGRGGERKGLPPLE